MFCRPNRGSNAVFYPVAIYRMYARVFGLAFLLWWASFVDDNVIKGPSRDRTEGRDDIFVAFCEGTGQLISPKTPRLSQATNRMRQRAKNLAERSRRRTPRARAKKRKNKRTKSRDESFSTPRTTTRGSARPACGMRYIKEVR